jgi:hypothetical protein
MGLVPNLVPEDIILTVEEIKKSKSFKKVCMGT